MISETRRTRPHGAVAAWLQGVAEKDLQVSAVTIGELQAGIEITREQDAARAAELETWLEIVATSYNVVSMDERCFRAWAKLMHGKPKELSEDVMIAATTEVHGLIVVTRNVKDFAALGGRTFDPFSWRRD